MLMRAAAIGPRFDLAVLAGLTRDSPARVRASLASACLLQLVEPVDGVPDRFQFRHALTRDAVYRELVEAPLRRLHRTIARVLERLPEGRRPAVEELAYHWGAARDAARGARYNEEAGDRAAALYARDEALRYYRRAFELAAGADARTRIAAKVNGIERSSVATDAHEGSQTVR